MLLGVTLLFLLCGGLLVLLYIPHLVLALALTSQLVGGPVPQLGLKHSRFLTSICKWPMIGLAHGRRIDILRFISRGHCLEKEK